MGEENLPLENNSYLLQILGEKEKIGVSQMTQKLIQEYNCTTTIEKSLCEIISLSYCRLGTTSQMMDQYLDFYPSKERVNYLAILSKELDRENRNYLTAINALMEIKNPNTTINVNTNNNYLGQNLQFNNIKNENIKD